MRILALNPSPMLGGAEFSLLDVLEGLAKRGHTVWLYAPGGGPLLATARARGITTHEWRMPQQLRRVGRYSALSSYVISPFAAAGPATALWRLYRKLQPDVIYSNGVKTDLLTIILARTTSIVWHVHDFLNHRGFAPLLFGAAKWLGIRVVVNSHAVSREWSTREIPVTVVHNGFVQPIFRKQKPIGKESSRLLAVGILAPWKGFEKILQACALLPEGLPWSLTICGDEIYETEGHTGERGRLKALARTLGIDNRVRFVGMARDLQPYWQSADVFLHGSVRPEPFGRVVAEAMNAGVPPIAPDCGGIPEIVRDGVDGLLYPMGDVLALRNSIVRLLESPETRMRMGRAARVRIATEFSADQKLSEIEAVLSGCQAPGAHVRHDHGEVKGIR